METFITTRLVYYQDWLKRAVDKRLSSEEEQQKQQQQQQQQQQQLSKTNSYNFNKAS